MSKTFVEALAVNGITVPDELIADIQVPVLAGPQRQGDVLIVPRKPLTSAERKAAQPIAVGESIAVVRGEAGGNTHWLNVDGEALWLRKESGVMLGLVEVAEEAVAYLTHEDEHGCNAMAPGTYSLHGKREQADEIRRVAD